MAGCQRSEVEEGISITQRNICDRNVQYHDYGGGDTTEYIF